MKKDVPTVVIDARMVSETPHGIGRYVRALARGLRARKELRYEPVFLIAGPGPEFERFRAVRVGAPFLSLAELVAVPEALRSIGADLYHSPSFSSLLWSPCPWLVTVHDLNHLTHGSLAKKIYYQTVLRSFMDRAQRVISVSNFSRHEISRWSGIPEQKIPIAANVLDPVFLSTQDDEQVAHVLKRHGLSRGGYFFALPNPKPHKNLALLRRAHEKASLAWPLFSGTGVKDSDLPALMQGAGAFVFPSLYEGYGLPPLEAAVLGAPVIVSDIPPHREALGDSSGVEWVDPVNEGQWTAALQKAFRGGIQPVSAPDRELLRVRHQESRLAEDMDQIYLDVLDRKS
ncbi:MAG: glycosyltransferase family 4 protein [Bdellovibrionota bacterium]